MKNKYNTELIKIETKNVLRVWLFMITGGLAIFGIWFFFQGIQFDSKYSVIYILASLLAIVFGFITFPMVLPVFKKGGKVLVSFTEGENGQIISRKQSVYYKDIKEIRLGHHVYSLSGIIFQGIIIRTHDNQLI